MNVHKNAILTPSGRALLVQRVLAGREPPGAVALHLGLSVRTVRKWVARWQSEGEAGLADRSSRPRRSPRALRRAPRRRIQQLRRRRRWSSVRIARELGLPLATVVRTLRRLGLNRLRPLAPPYPLVRYERERAGELLHLDVKKLGRITPAVGRLGHRVTGRRGRKAHGRAGWEFLHVAIDDATRLAYAEVLPDELGATAAAFLDRAARWYGGLGIRPVERVMTDNGSAYVSREFAGALAACGARHLRTRPYTPRTNGKVERLIRTLLAEWAYATPYRSSEARVLALAPYLEYYNTQRPHTALTFRTPLQRLRAGTTC
ncbi:MAG: IS481 family transposase [Gemmatimonadaceae bacterium]